MDITSNPEVNDDTVLYAASAKIVDTVRADHEHLGHIPLLQLKKMIQTNLIHHLHEESLAHNYLVVWSLCLGQYLYEAPECYHPTGNLIQTNLIHHLHEESLAHNYLVVWSLCLGQY